MNISGVLVRSRPAQIDAVSGRLTALPGVEVHGANDDGRIVAALWLWDQWRQGR